MLAIVALLATTLSPLAECEPVCDTCDLIEVNEFCDENGKLVFEQVIFWDYLPLTGDYVVGAWRLLKESDQVPVRNWRTGAYTAVWHDGDVLRRVSAPAIHRTITQFDPELANREILDKAKRRDLVKPKQVTNGH